MIFEHVQDLRNLLQGRYVVATSGGFDPLHVGHLRCIQESANYKLLPDYGHGFGSLVVIVNSDEFLLRKKGFIFMPLEQRLEMIDGLRGVDYVVSWEDGTQFVTGALEILQPNVFTKGGDRSIAANVPEFDMCQQIGCEVVFGVGGRNKIQSSSELTRVR